MCSLKYWQTSFKNHTREKTGILKAERLRDALLEVGMSCTVITNGIHHDDRNRDAKVGCGFCQMWIQYALESVITFIVMTGSSINNVLGVYCKSLCFHILLLVLIFTTDGQGLKSRQGQKNVLFSKTSRQYLVPTHLPIQCEFRFLLGSKVAEV